MSCLCIKTELQLLSHVMLYIAGFILLVLLLSQKLYWEALYILVATF